MHVYTWVNVNLNLTKWSLQMFPKNLISLFTEKGYICIQWLGVKFWIIERKLVNLQLFYILTSFLLNFWKITLNKTFSSASQQYLCFIEQSTLSALSIKISSL